MSHYAKYAGAVAATIILTTASGFASGDEVKAAVAQTTSVAAEIGKKAPDFALTDSDGKTQTLHQYLEAGKTVVLYWFNANCPVIIRHFEKNHTFANLYSAYNARNVAFVAVNSTNPQHPQFGGDVDRKKEWTMQYPILLDPTGSVGKLYGAKTTPHVYVITSDGIIRYAGAVDDDPQNEKTDKEKINYVSKALDEIMSGKPVTISESRPYGCGVKYAE